MEDVALKKGVKRTVEELVGDETFSLYMESLQVPDLVSPYFKTNARISGNTWQAVINITKLGGTGVSLFLVINATRLDVLPSSWQPLSCKSITSLKGRVIVKKSSPKNLSADCRHADMSQSLRHVVVC